MNSIINFSEAASIALHSIVLISKTDKYLNVTKISELTGSSKHHVAKVMQRLVKERYVKSMRGPAGGFVLVRDPAEINFLNIYETIEGKFSSSEECPFHKKKECVFSKCLLNNITVKMTQDFINYMKKQYVIDYI